MDPKEKKQKLNTSEIASPSFPKMDLNKQNKKQKVSQSLITMVIPSPSIISKVDVEEAMKKQNDVAMLLAEKVISAVARNSNFVFSPASISTVLTMVAATSEVETLRSFILSMLRSSSIDELNAVFREIATIVLVDGSASGGPKISSVNGVWMEQSLSIDPSLKNLFENFFENFFKATFARVDFQFKAEEVREEVNSWASKHTDGLIKDILPPRSVKGDTECIYGNALYFKGAWEHKFPKFLTRSDEFHLLDGRSVSVPFLRNSRSQRQYVEEYNGFKVLKLPFRQCGDINRQFSMYLYLPDAKDGLDNLVKRMASSSRGFLDSHIPREKVIVGQFRIPKFTIGFGFKVSTVFNGLDDLKVYHRALVEIDEDGAEAVAVTAARGGGSARYCSVRRIDFVADHPFLFMIREDKTGTVLFVGQIFDPSKSSSD